MSIASSLHNATTGLTASARAVQVASANVANVLTPGYAARRLDLASSSLGGAGSGVRIAGITRMVDPVTLGLHRDAGASTAASTYAQKFWQSVETAMGLPDKGVSAALSAFESALISASERPDLDNRLSRIVETGTALAKTLATVEDRVQTLRMDADAQIARDVDTVNNGLIEIDKLNEQIVKMRLSGQSTLGLEDERQELIGRLSEIVPIKEYPRDHGRVMIYSASGRLLLDTQPATLGFSPTVAIDASMSVGVELSGLTINGQAVSTAETGPLGGGRLAAAFTARDINAVSAQSQIDSYASDLIARFADPATDATLAGGVGFFTDEDGPDTGLPGLAGRLSVNTLVDPANGGALWRLRDGIGAAAAGPVGDATQINAMLGALERTISSGPGAPLQDSATTLGAILADISTERQWAEDGATTARTRLDTLTEAMLEQGVDTDAEMQKLLLIEEAYAANARVIQTADAMIRTLLEI
ncbi:flagellar hook-associated protein FlgK [Rhodobacter sp. NTK016B]|uniref:flagellar hook-associated protein FlgK n=1 Tax=Rhodobacter sp. NTK016B TaxID=2759676 RepID=UPI001A8FFDB0|nr:flagellar hook-associated protein FlgK [Rhodobacter sp. NTK016B]MBN8293318.1 flagellar hook-associated protein FlgK [Rhodobacter sp. NTK016B]